MAFRTNPAPYQRAKHSTTWIMLALCVALLIVWGFGIAYSFKLDGLVNAFLNEYNANATAANKETIELVNYGLRSILIVLVALVTTAACDVCTTLVKYKKGGKLSLGKQIVDDLIHNYSYVTAIIFALTVPVYISYYVVILGSIFATVVVKNLFGGFGKNIFNPAIMARIFVGLCFVNQFAVPSELALSGVGVVSNGVSGSTLTTAYNDPSMGWLSTTITSGITTVDGIFADFTMTDMLFGQYVGALGETFTLVIFVLGIVLSFLKVINWRTPVFYLGTVALTALGIALACGFNNPLNYVLYHLSLGGVMFGAVFMLTDPVTGPTSPYGKSLIGVIAGFLTVLIRVKGSYPEGVMFSIALCNFISPVIDYLTVGKSNSHLIRKSCVVVATLLLSVGLCTGLSFSLNGGREVYAINGMDVAEYTLIENNFTLKENHSIQLADDYVVKTGDGIDVNADGKLDYKISGFVINEETNESLDAVYYIVDENGAKVATLYSIQMINSQEITHSGYGVGNVKGGLFVAINEDGSLYGVSTLSNLTTYMAGSKSYYMDSSVTEYYGKFTGLNSSNIEDAGKVTDATQSSTLIKKLITAVYAEHNA